MLKSPGSLSELDERISRPNDAWREALAALPGRFLVLGAGGKMGWHTSLTLQRSLQLLGRQEPVTVVSRFGSEKQRRLFEKQRFQVLACDLSQPTAVASLPDADYVIFLAGVKFGTSDNPELLHRMNVLMPELVAARYRNSAIVALSTGCVYSFTTPASGGSTEASPTDPPGAYARSCLGREMAFHRAAANDGTRSALIRLNYSNDLRYGVLIDIAQRILARQPVSLETGYVNVIWQGDAIDYILRSLTHVSAPPWILNVTGTECLRVHDIAVRIAELCGCEVEFTGEEGPLAWLNNAAQAHALFGPPSVDADTLMQWTVAWLQQGGETLNKPTHFEVRDGAY